MKRTPKNYKTSTRGSGDLTLMLALVGIIGLCIAGGSLSLRFMSAGATHAAAIGPAEAISVPEERALSITNQALAESDWRSQPADRPAQMARQLLESLSPGITNRHRVLYIKATDDAAPQVILADAPQAK